MERSMRRRHRWCVPALRAVAFATATVVAGGSARASGSGSCRDEIRHLCPDAQGRQAMRQCIEERRAELSETCQQKLSNRKGRGGHGGGIGRRGGW